MHLRQFRHGDNFCTFDGNIDRTDEIVHVDANRTLVKDAVETLFNVKVVRVNIINAPAKRSRSARSRRLAIHNSGYKKAIVTLDPEHRINFF